jgi:Domain of unknown function (DUF3821)
MFIIRVLKLLFMQGRYILPAFIVILLVCSPVAASTGKVAAGAPVFIGERNLDITSAIGDCHVIAWWPEGANTSAPPAATLTVKNLNEATGLTKHFNVTPGIFTGRTGAWYCEDKAPYPEILYVLDPQFTILVWDMDNNTDVSGQTIPVTANVSYRIDTNLYLAANYYNRTNLNPSDTIFSVSMTDPFGKNVPNIYTGNSGAADTQIMTFDSSPFITTPVYFGAHMNGWDLLARDARGSLIYPTGTYYITASQNLGNMQQAYADAGISGAGRTTGMTSVTFINPVTPSPTATLPPSVPEVSPAASSPETPVAPLTTAQPVTSRTPYQPLPEWIPLAGLLIGLICFARPKA